MDQARKKTDKELKAMERRIKEVYSHNLALQRIQKKYDAYMKSVQMQTEDAYKAYKSESDNSIRQELKKAYMNQVKALTLKNKTYKSIVSEFARIMAQVNQEALNIVNAELGDIYTLNYNQVAVDCERVGIEVNG